MHWYWIVGLVLFGISVGLDFRYYVMKRWNKTQLFKGLLGAAMFCTFWPIYIIVMIIMIGLIKLGIELGD